MNKKYIVVLVVIAIIAIGGLYFPKGNTVVQQVTEKLGAVSSLDGVDNPYWRIGGVKRRSVSLNMVATSSVVCALQNGSATSTLVGFSAVALTNGLGTQLYDVSTSSSQYASGSTYGSSSPAYIKAFSSGTGQFSLIWDPSSSSTDTRLIGSGYEANSHNIIGPNKWLTVRIATSTPGTFSGGYLTGRCNFELQEL